MEHSGQFTGALLCNFGQRVGVFARNTVCSIRDVLQRESAVAYFKTLVDDALEHQRVEADELTSFYVVQLLASFLRRPGDGSVEPPRALCLVEALASDGVHQRATLRRVGDMALFVSGFFSDSLRRKPVGVSYYTAIGCAAYGALSRNDTDTFSPAFAELSRRFVRFVDVLSEVSERTGHTVSDSDLLRLYERWLTTGSVRARKRLIQHGLVPEVPSGRLH